MTGQPLIVLHLLKTGGTALKHYFEQALDEEEQISQLGEEKETEAQLQRVSRMSSEERARIRVVFGHFARELRAPFPQGRNITVVREPFARLMSQYVYQRHNAKALNIDPATRPLPGEVSMDELCEAILGLARQGGSAVFNLQARTIAHFLFRDPDSVSESDLGGLVENFAMIGLQEHFALFLFLLHRQYDLPLIPMPIVYSYGDPIGQYFPPGLIEECNVLGKLDVQLYELAKAKFADAVANVIGTSRSAMKDWEDYRLASCELLQSPAGAKPTQ